MIFKMLPNGKCGQSNEKRPEKKYEKREDLCSYEIHLELCEELISPGPLLLADWLISSSD